MAEIHPSAIVAQEAELAESVRIGPLAVIGPGVRIRAGTEVCAHVVIEGLTEIGEDNFIGPFACLGAEPQHTAYRGEETRLVIGSRNKIREYVTIHRGTAHGGGETLVGNDNFIMVGCHIAHDCKLGNGITMANQAQLAGHVRVEDHAVFGGLTGVHQYARVGECAMVAALSGVSLDAPPFSLVGGERARLIGLNRIGLKRREVPSETIQAIRRAYRIIFQSAKLLKDALEQTEAELGDVPEVKHLIQFIRTSERGVLR
jgi:UDP-N-acetylglucosamine acyltransferase